MSPNVAHVPSCHCTACKPTCADPPTLDDWWVAYASDGRELLRFQGVLSWLAAKSHARWVLGYAPHDVRLAP